VRLHEDSIGGIRFYYREGFSDLKTFEEVIRRKAYLKRGMTIQPGESWMDCGGNVGAFALLACSLGAEVTVYEPDPYHCELIQKNLRLNGFRADIKQAALVHDSRAEVVLFVGNNNQTWRNSIVKSWNGRGLKVPSLNFDQEVQRYGFRCCKMDIEGAEMPILEHTSAVFQKLVYEWSFDIDSSLQRIWSLIERQKSAYRVEAAWSSIRWEKRDYEHWQKSWFPACTNVFCFSERNP
jgi:FkbM family methyltransferase